VQQQSNLLNGAKIGTRTLDSEGSRRFAAENQIDRKLKAYLVAKEGTSWGLTHFHSCLPALKVVEAGCHFGGLCNVHDEGEEGVQVNKNSKKAIYG